MTNRPEAAPIRILTLGTLRVLRDGVEVDEHDWRTRQARQLLKILVTERPRPVSTDRIIEILWPNSTPSAASTTLRSAVNALRNVLEPERPNRAPSSYIYTQTPGYAYRSHPNLWLDVEAFEQHLDEAARLPAAEERRKHVEAALALYADDYLMDDPYADWAKAERERLRERFFDALLDLAALHAQDGHYSAAISACRRVLARDEVRENAYQALMRYQAESGDSAGALLTYERCRLLLGEQLGADPSPMTQQLHTRILNGEIDTVAVETLTAHATPSARPVVDAPMLPQHSLLPPQERSDDPFVGRRQETATIESALQQALHGQGSIVVLAGEMGVGKSRLAYQMLRSAESSSATVISATCQRLEQSLPYAPLADAVGRYLQLLPDGVLRRLSPAVLAQLVQIVPSLQDRLPNDIAPQDAPLGASFGAEENRRRLIDAIVTFFVDLAQQRPLVLFLDDLHWADAETLAVVSRLIPRMQRHPFLLLLAYRQGDLVENVSLQTLLHALRRSPHSQILPVDRLSQDDVLHLVQQWRADPDFPAEKLAQMLYATTAGNALFLVEAIRALQERTAARPSLAQPVDRHLADLSRRERVQEIIQERIERLPGEALSVLQLAAVIGRDFSLDLLERAVSADPVQGLDVLLRRQFLIERLDDRLDFVHQVVRQVAYDGLNALLRRRLHRQVALALAAKDQHDRNPAEIAFHFGEAGRLNQAEYAQYSVLAGEQLLRSFSLNQALTHFDNALSVFEELPDADADLVRRAWQGRGLAYENLLDPDGVTDTYTRLRRWALQTGHKDLALLAHTRLTTLLGLVGQQAESNALMKELILDEGSTPSRSLADLLDRHQRLFSPEESEEVEDADSAVGWAALQPPASAPADPVGEISAEMGHVHAALPLLIYGWALQVQGQLAESARVLAAAVTLAESTEQRSLAGLAYHQLSVTARLQGETVRSHALNEQSKALNQQVHGTAAQLASVWPRISSAYQALARGDLDLAVERLQRIELFLAERDSFRTHHNSTVIGLGLAALAAGDLDRADDLLARGLADPVNRYPFTFVKGLLGLAQIAHRRHEDERCVAILQRALHYAGSRSLVREYTDCVQAIVELVPARAPLAWLQAQTAAENASHVNGQGRERVVHAGR
ncbi:AAA family ATPase [bacterium]|nr:AAA family ATPase [bacterium]